MDREDHGALSDNSGDFQLLRATSSLVSLSTTVVVNRVVSFSSWSLCCCLVFVGVASYSRSPRLDARLL
jgi:hypothetical protein